MKHKTKVIAFRVTDEEYDALLLAATKQHKKITDFVREALWLVDLVYDLVEERKRLEAKAKRAAKKAAAAQVVPDGNA